MFTLPTETYTSLSRRISRRVSRRNRILLLTSLLAAVGILSLVERLGPKWREDGVSWRTKGTELVAEVVVAGSPAANAGLRTGDVLVAVADHRVSTPENVALELSRSIADGAEVEYRIRRGGVETRHHLQPITLPAGDRRLYTYLSLMGFFCLGLGTLVAMRRPGEPLRLHFAALCALFFVVYAVSDSGRLDAVDWGLLLLDSAGIAWTAVGENLAGGWSLPQAVFEAWLSSAPHRANLEDERWTHAGAALSEDGSGGRAATLLFVRP